MRKTTLVFCVSSLVLAVEKPTLFTEPKLMQAAVPKMAKRQKQIRLQVTGQGVAPTNTQSPAQAYALAKRAAITDAYRLIAERIAGVKIEGRDMVKNAIISSSQVRLQVDALVSKAFITETRFDEGLCEVDMELIVTADELKAIALISNEY